MKIKKVEILIIAVSLSIFSEFYNWLFCWPKQCKERCFR